MTKHRELLQNSLRVAVMMERREETAMKMTCDIYLLILTQCSTFQRHFETAPPALCFGLKVRDFQEAQL